MFVAHYEKWLRILWKELSSNKHSHDINAKEAELMEPLKRKWSCLSYVTDTCEGGLPVGKPDDRVFFLSM